jgi:hypothetical protein
MDRSRYAARLGSAQESAADLVLNEQDASSSPLRAPARFGPSSVGFFALPSEPEDARLTGGTRSLSRRLLGLNLSGRVARPGTYPNRSDSSAA